MRNKTLLLAAALSVVGMMTVSAQVYSVNAVGYVNTTLKPKLNMVSNPLMAATNTVEVLFPPVADMTIYKYGASGYQIANYIDGLGWDASFTLVPGEGAFVNNPRTTNVIVTFVGDVMQGSLSNPLPKGLSMKSSQVPQAGKLVTDLKFPAFDDDTIYLWDTSVTPAAYDIYNNIPGIGWDNAKGEPTVGVGQAFFVNKALPGTLTSTNWTRTFSVNP